MNSQCEVQLRNQVSNIAKSIETGQYETDSDEGCSAWDYITDALDIEYISSARGEYLGARILVAFGGPNIWINTRSRQVEGLWWSDSFTASYYDDKLDLDSYLQEHFECMR